MLLTQNQILLFKKAIKDKLIKVLFFDLETSPSKFWGWGTGEQYVSHSQLVSGTETKIITAQYKYGLVDKKAKYLEWDWKQQVGGIDVKLVQEIIRLINEADLVIGQNSKQFDIKVLQERAKVLQLPPVNVDFMIDTLTASRSSVKAMSHKLDYRSKQHGFGGKYKMEFKDWIDIVEGVVSPLKKMVPYGLKDVEDTEKVFWRELPYYNLPKTTVNKILKLILHPDELIKVATKRYVSRRDEKQACPKCSKSRQRRFETEIRMGKLYCRNCESTFD